MRRGLAIGLAAPAAVAGIAWAAWTLTDPNHDEDGPKIYKGVGVVEALLLAPSAFDRILRAAGIAAIVILLGTGAAHPGHNTPPPPLPAGHGLVLVRLVRAPDEREPIPSAQVVFEAVGLHPAGAAPGERWLSLPLLRPEFSAQELAGGQVWLASAPVPAGEFDRLRLGAGDVPIALRVVPGQTAILTLEVGLEAGRPGAAPRLKLRRARPLGP